MTVFEGHALRIALLEPHFRGITVGEYFEVVGVTEGLTRIDNAA